jgi:hypothetical protein
MSASQLEDAHLADLVDAWPAPSGLEGFVIEVLESVFLPEHGAPSNCSRSSRNSEPRCPSTTTDPGTPPRASGEDRAYIKLDRSFLGERHLPEAREALVRSAIEMSHVFGAEVVAEGIEDEAQRSMVVDLGVEYLQGFAIARPMPLTELLTWLDERPARI